MTRLLATAVLLPCFCFVAPARADLFNLSATIDQSQENPPTGSSGTGMAIITVDDVSNLLTWDISWSGLTGPATAMHFHEGPVGVNGPVVLNIGTISGLNSPSIGSATITPTQVQNVLDELWYINIHTAAFPGGEIRGQVVPEPSSLAIAGLGAAGLFLVARRRRIK